MEKKQCHEMNTELKRLTVKDVKFTLGECIQFPAITGGR